MQDVQVKQGTDPKAILVTVLEHKWVVLTVFLVFTSIVSYYSISKPTLFRSSSILYYDNSANNPVAELIDKTNFQTVDFNYYEVILKTDLFDRRFKETIASALIRERGAEYAAKALRDLSAEQITLRPYNKEAVQFIEIMAVSSDSFLVKKMIEIATDELRKRASEIDKEGLQSGIDFINDQIEITKNNLEKTELELQELKKRTDITSKDIEGPLNKVILMKDKVSELETQIQVRSANLATLSAQLDSIQRRIAGSGNATAQSKEELTLKQEIESLTSKKATLFERLGNDAYSHPDVVAIDTRLAELRNRYYAVLSSAASGSDATFAGDFNQMWKNLFDKKNNEEIELLLLKGQARLYNGLIKNFEAKNPNLLQDAIDVTRLGRLKQVYEETLSSLIKQKETFSIQFYVNSGNLKIIDPAKPPVPIYNKVFTTIFVGAMVGLLIGVGLAMALEYLDNTIKSIESINSVTNLPIIGKIPPIETTGSEAETAGPSLLHRETKDKNGSNGEVENKNLLRKRAMISQLNPRSFVSERYRSLRTNIQFANIDTPLRSILVSSAGPGEGKTTTAVNLAISFADMGHSVCLVDADLRKPKHHILFDAQESPGLVDVVLHQIEPDKVIQPTAIKNLSMLSVGHDAFHHSEIFSTMRMSFLMNELEKRFDIVIYDTPPVLLITDSVILSSRVDGVVLIVKYSLTQKQFLQSALSQLKTVRANVLGIVLNDFAEERRQYYQYAYDSYYVNDSQKQP